jgi:hypothetical protein
MKVRGVEFFWLPHEYRDVIHDAFGSRLAVGRASGAISFSPSSNTAGIYSQGKTEARSRTTQYKAGYPALCPVKDIGFPVHTTLVSLASLHLTS